MNATGGCPAGHPQPGRSETLPGPRACPGCRRERIAEAVVLADPTLPRSVVVAALDAVGTHPAVLRELAAALDADPGALSVGAPPVIGRLLAALRTAGSVLPAPGCAACGRALLRHIESLPTSAWRTVCLQLSHRP